MQHYNSKIHNDIIYYNCSIISNKQTDDGTSNYVTFQESRDNDIIDDVSKYYFSIIRFDINGPNKGLPLLLVQAELNQPDPNKTIYKVGMELEVEYDIQGVTKSGKFITTQSLIYQPQTTENIKVNPPIEQQDYSNTYYYMYNYSHFTSMLNFAFKECLNQLNADFQGWYNQAGAPNLRTKSPYVKWNPQSQSFDLFTDIYSSSNNSSSQVGFKEKLRIFFNSNLYNLVSYNAMYHGGDTIESNTLGIPNFTYEILINYEGANIIKEIGNDGNSTGIIYIETTQDYKSTCTLWNPIESIVFSSTIIPINSEQTGTPIEITDNNVVSRSTSSSFQPIITDISLDTNDSSAYRNFISYIPSGEYRLSEMKGSGPLRDIDINVYYKLRQNQKLIPMEMINGSSINVKIMFRKK